MDAIPPAKPDRRAATRQAEERAGRIRLAVYEFLTRREGGEDVAAEAFQAAHPDLMPELADAIAAALRNYRHVYDGRRAWGGETDPPPAASAEAAGPAPAVAIRGYRFRREISSGGQGTVFEAVHEPTGRVVAVKVMTGVSRNSVARFDREAQALAALSHPGLVGILDRGLTASGSYYLSVEYVAGRDLDDWVRACRRDGRRVRDVVALLAKVAAALEAAHARGIVHRDIKPSNVRVDALDNPRVIDFGLAHFVGDLEKAGSGRAGLTVTRDIVGSLHWLSPEQASGNARTVTAASDVYSLGVLMYHALTGGRFPYPVDGPIHETVRNICETPPTDPARADEAPLGAIDPALAGVVLRCMAKRPMDRYPSAGPLAADLEAYLAGTLAPPPAPASHRPRLRWSAFVVIGLTLLAAVGWVVGRYAAVEPDPDPPVQLPTFTNPIGMEFVLLPAGRFKMGSPRDESGRNDDEQPHVVQLTRGFAMGRTEVTRAQYRRVMGELPPGVGPEPGDLPVDQVTPEEADAFCHRLGQLDGRHYRLPTEAEWEYACRSGTLGPFGSRPKHFGEETWNAANSGGTLHPVGAKVPNRWGLFDMQGNAAELTADRYVPYLGSADRVDPTFKTGGPIYTVRGGTALSAAEDCRAASRSWLQTGMRKAAIGFRVAADATGTGHGVN